MTTRKRTILAAVLTALLVLPLIAPISCDSGDSSIAPTTRLVTLTSSPEGIMGTWTELTVVVDANDTAVGRAAMAAATGALRDVEAMMSSFLAASPVSRLNAAKAGEAVDIPPELAALLGEARRFTELSGGAFDVTVGPIVQLWKAAGKAGKAPSEAELARVRARVGMDRLKVASGKAVKAVDGLSLDLGGIAKGYGVDRAAEALTAVKAVRGGLVNVGGEIRSFGVKPDGSAWRIGVQHPFRKGLAGVMALTDAAVATSGDYERFAVIDGVRYSHIVDPRTARPVRRTHSVTVVSLATAGRAPSCTDADAWATALSVMGPSALAKLEGTGIEAVIITGTPEKPEIHRTPGFARLLAPGTKIELD